MFRLCRAARIVKLLRTGTSIRLMLWTFLQSFKVRIRTELHELHYTSNKTTYQSVVLPDNSEAEISYNGRESREMIEKTSIIVSGQYPC